MKVTATENDALGMELVRERLPQRVRTSRGSQDISASGPGGASGFQRPGRGAAVFG